MLKYIIKRLLCLIPVILGITFFIYLVMALSPGDPVELILGPEATQEQRAAKTAELGLDKPLLSRYFDYLKDVCQGNFGRSWVRNFDILDEFLARFPSTFIIALLGTAVTVIVGVPMGVISAIRQNRPSDNVISIVALILSAIPGFWLALLAQVYFALQLGWFPSIGLETPKHYVLPVLTLSASTIAAQVRMTRSSVLDVIGQDFVRTARAKGAKEGQVIVRHVLTNAFLPIITETGNSFAGLLGGAVMLEQLYSITGIGNMMLNGVTTRDIPVVMGILIFVAFLVGIVNLLVDLLYSFFDPRVKSVFSK